MTQWRAFHPVLRIMETLRFNVAHKSHLKHPVHPRSRMFPTRASPCQLIISLSRLAFRRKFFILPTRHLAEHTLMPLIPLEGAILWESCVGMKDVAAASTFHAIDSLHSLSLLLSTLCLSYLTIAYPCWEGTHRNSSGCP